MGRKAFITNEKGAKTLKTRVRQLIEHSRELKFLVGFFYFSGWAEIYDVLKSRNDLTVRILVGLQVDMALGRLVEHEDADDRRSHEDIAEGFFASLKNALNADETDVQDVYEQIDLFLTLIEQGRLHIRKTLAPNHAKLYIFKIKEELKNLTDTKFITGSSNLTRSGFLEQNEFNVEIGDYGVDEADGYFNALWADAVPITEDDRRRKDLTHIIRHKTQVATVTPFEAYVSVLRAYVELHEQRRIKPSVLQLLDDHGYRQYNYQLDAVNQALSILETYNGVIVADVVGLGKSVIASMIGKNMMRRGIVLCPPSLIGDKEGESGWRKYANDFQLHGWEVWSSGDLEGAQKYLTLHGGDVDAVIVDEAARFRNQDTQDYELLSMICRNRKVILLTATPFNNSPEDIFSMLKLFIVPGKSKITLDDNLEARFSYYNALFMKLAFISKNHASADKDKRNRAARYFLEVFGQASVDMAEVRRRAKQLSGEIRANIEPVLIRRNRIDLRSDPVYEREVTNLADIADPRELFFELSREQSQFYDDVINTYFGEDGTFQGAIYRPFMYEKKIDPDKMGEEENRIYRQQANLYDFMRRLVVKRFESSFGAFKQTIENFIGIHELVLEFIQNSGGKYILDRKLIEKISAQTEEEIEEALESFAKRLKERHAPKHDKIYAVDKFVDQKGFMDHIESDIRLLKEIRGRVEELKLVKNDPKARKLVEALNDILSAKPLKGEPGRKVIIFSEYVDTVRHLTPILEKTFPGKVFICAGQMGTQESRALLTNFDAAFADQEDTYQILLSSDRLSEGVNLNRAGAVINYDIPWNPTRVIQRVGRINRISAKIFSTLYIYNFFPTEQGADIVRSRQIAEQKMFLIHHTLGEDARIFAVDEEPRAAELYKRINQNPDQMDDEAMLTRIRREYHRLKTQHPDVIAAIDGLPARVKTAKTHDANQLTVYRRKGLAFFVQHIADLTAGDVKITSPGFVDSLDFIRCGHDEPKRGLSERFWAGYEAIKLHRDVVRVPKNENALEIRATNNLQAALKHYKTELEPYVSFIRTLLLDMRDYGTLSKYTLRRLTDVDLTPEKNPDVGAFKKEVRVICGYLGADYLDVVIERLGTVRSEIIIAIENVRN